jgi:hypothetical protein
MKKILIIPLTILMVFCLCSVSVFAVTEGEVQSQVAAQGKEKVTGNIFIWFLCAIAFLKVSQKIDSFMSSLGINVGHTGGSMLGELMIAFKGVQAISGGSFGSSHGGGGGSSSGSGSDAAFLSGGLAGAVGRTTERHAASSVTNQQSHTISQKLYNSSVQKGGDFANTVIGAVAKGSIRDQGTITGERAAEAMTSYFGYTGKANAPQFSETEIGGGRIIGKESIGGGAPTEFAMYNADQYMKPEGAFTLETAKDGSKWYKQVPEDTVQRTPYMDANGDVQYNESIVKQLPQIPRRKDRV